jgi:hypothetical protein
VPLLRSDVNIVIIAVVFSTARCRKHPGTRDCPRPKLQLTGMARCTAVSVRRQRLEHCGRRSANRAAVGGCFSVMNVSANNAAPSLHLTSPAKGAFTIQRICLSNYPMRKKGNNLWTTNRLHLAAISRYFRPNLAHFSYSENREFILFSDFSCFASNPHANCRKNGYKCFQSASVRILEWI